MLSMEINTTAAQQSIKLIGKLKGMAALELRTKIGSIIESDAKKVVLDLTQTDQIDLTGFNAIVIFNKEVTQNGQDFILVADTKNAVHEFIHLSKLEIHCVQQLNK